MKRTLLFLLIAAALVAVVLAAISAVAHRTRSVAASESKAPSTTGSQLWHCGMHPQVIQDHPGDCPICHMALTPMTRAGGASASERKVLYWWDPMLGTSSISEKPGKSAMGMDLVPVYAESAGPEVQIDPRVVQNMGVRTEAVTKGSLRKTVRTVGLLSLPEPGLHDVSLRVNGWIEKLYVNQEGMHVNKGEPLFEVYSPELQVGAQELIAVAKAFRNLPENTGGTVRSESERMVQSAKRKLRLWGVGEEEVESIAKASEPPRVVTFRSPSTGHVEEKMVVEGASVQQGMKLLRIADHTSMWLDLQVYEGQLPFVKAGQAVTATVSGIPGKNFKGTVTFLYPHLEHESRTLKVRATLENPDFELKPGMYATAEISGAPVTDATLAPREAVIDTGTSKIAFVSDGSGRFEPRKVRTGLTGDDNKVQILDGLTPGEMVVTSGQFLMDVESRTIEATQKLSAGKETPVAVAATSAPAQAAASEMKPETKNDETPLTRVYCPMVKADWLQREEKVVNPYMGERMLTCGEVKGKVPFAKSSELQAFTKSYLDVSSALAADKLDPQAMKALRQATEKLPEKEFTPLKEASKKLSEASDIKAARAALKFLSAELLNSLGAK